MEIKLYTLLILLGTYSHIKIECCYKISANGKGLGFCGVYAQETFHAIEPNQCACCTTQIYK